MEPDERGIREDMEEAQGRETVIRIYYLREKNLFSIKGKKKRKPSMKNNILNKEVFISRK